MSHKFWMQSFVAALSFAVFLFIGCFNAQSCIHAGQEKITVYSDILNENREIIINLPDDYNFSSKSYPVLFVLDAEGERRLNLTIAGYNYFSGVRRLPKMIIVGIPNTDRTRDISPYKIQQRESSGGGGKFLNFITDELIHYIESNFRSSDYKILFGASSAGTFSIYSLYCKPNSFNAIISSRPALNSTTKISWKSEIIIERMNEFLKTEKCSGKSIYIDYGGQEDDFHDPEPIFELNDLITGYSPQKLKTIFVKTTESGYRSAESLVNGLLWIFNDWYYPADSLYVNGFEGIKIHANNLSDVYDYDINAADLLSLNELIMFGYRFLEQGSINEAINLFSYGSEVYPQSWQVFNCLAEANMEAGNDKLAFKYYKKSLELNPENNNAKEALRRLQK